MYFNDDLLSLKWRKIIIILKNNNKGTVKKEESHEIMRRYARAGNTINSRKYRDKLHHEINFLLD